MKKIIIILISILFLSQTYAQESVNQDFRKKVFYFPTGNYYYTSNPDIAWFISWDFYLQNAITNNKELWDIFNALFPEESCEISMCWINKKKLLFETILKYNYYKNKNYDNKASEFKEEIEVAKSRYTDSNKLNSDLKDIESKVPVLIENINSHLNFWEILSKIKISTEICGNNIYNWKANYNMKMDIETAMNNPDIYMLVLPTNIDTWYQSDSISPTYFSWKNEVHTIKSLEDIEALSSISTFQKANITMIDKIWNFPIEFDYYKQKEEIKQKLSKIYETYNNQELKVNTLEVILLYKNEEWKLVFWSKFNPNTEVLKNSNLKEHCSREYKIDFEESFNHEVHNSWIPEKIGTIENKLVLKKIENIFNKLDNTYDFWNLEGKVDKGNFYLILGNFYKKLKKYDETLNKEINNFSNLNYEQIVKNKNEIEKTFEKKMFIDYMIQKVKFRIN